MLVEQQDCEMVGKMTTWWNDKLMKWQVGEMTGWWNDKLVKWLFAEMEN